MKILLKKKKRKERGKKNMGHNKLITKKISIMKKIYDFLFENHSIL